MKVTAKRVVRVVQALLLVLLIAYLAVVDTANPQTIFLPFLLSLPTAWVIGAALLLGFVIGCLSLSGRVLRLRRENRSFRQRLIRAGLETEPRRTENQRAEEARASARRP